MPSIDIEECPLEIDPTRLKWKLGEDFLSYTSTRKPPSKSISTKWHNILTPNLKLKWGNVWDKTRGHKERTFIWSIWNEVVAVNMWRVRFIVDIDNKCHMCSADMLETIAHRFWA